MESYSKFTSKVAVLPVNNIDTDQIIPASFLKATDKTGLGDNLFSDWRYNPDGSPKKGLFLMINAFRMPPFFSPGIILAAALRVSMLPGR